MDCYGDILEYLFFSKLVSSAIKANSVLRQQRPRGMYSKVSFSSQSVKSGSSPQRESPMGAQDLYVLYTPCRWWGLPRPQRVNT